MGHSASSCKTDLAIMRQLCLLLPWYMASYPAIVTSGMLPLKILDPSLPIATPSCPSGWVHAHAEGCFAFLSETNVTWINAMSACEKMGGYLAQPKTQEQMEFLHGLAEVYAQFTGVHNWWLGLTDMGHEGIWEWLHTMEEVTETFWAYGSPSNEEGNIFDCGSIQLSQGKLLWRDVDCSALMDQHGAAISPVCQRGNIDPDDKTTPTPTKPTDAPTRSSPAPTRPTHAPTRPTHLPTRPTYPPTRPTHPPTRPTDAPTRPTHPPTRPTDPLTRPTDAPTRPTDPPTRPTDPPTRPTDAPTRPTDAPNRPTDPPKRPTDPPTRPSHAPSRPTDAPTRPSPAPTRKKTGNKRDPLMHQPDQ